MSMNTDELAALLDAVEKLRAEGKEDEAKELLRSRLQELPEDVQDRMMFDMFTSALREEMEGLEAVREMQKQGLQAADELTRQRKALEG